MLSRESLFKLANDKQALTAQYAGMENYKHRKTDTLLQWYAEQYTGSFDLRNVDDILELGCGDGTFWKYIANGQPFQPHVVITDFVAQMLDECKENLSATPLNVEFQTADIDALPFAAATFNAVLAHKVIYHAQDPAQSIASIQRILTPHGFLGLSVLNSGVYQSIWKLASDINPQIPDASLSAAFNDVDAQQVLPTYFPHITTRTYLSTKTYAASEPVVEYVRSNPLVQPLNLSDNFFTLFKEKVDEVIESKGAFKTEYNSNLYLCQK